MRTILAALLLVALSSVTACSDDDPPMDTSTTPSGTPAEGAPPSETATGDLPSARNACKVLDPEEVGRALGTTVERVTAERGCRFASPDDPGTASLGISQGELAASGGLDGAKAGVGTVIEGEPEDLPDVGDGAFVIVGTTAFGDEAPTGGGAVALGSSLIQVTVIPGPDTADDAVRQTTVDVLTLIAEKAKK